MSGFACLSSSFLIQIFTEWLHDKNYCDCVYKKLLWLRVEKITVPRRKVDRKFFCLVLHSKNYYVSIVNINYSNIEKISIVS